MRRIPTLALALTLALLSASCVGDDPVAPDTSADISSELRAEAPTTSNACWGQASKVFAQMGEMGPHSSSQSNPRAGLRNLARLLYGLGVIEDDTMAALGRFVADELGLSIEACMS